jgi:hypothetical protein
MSLWNSFLDNIAKPVGRTFVRGVQYAGDTALGVIGSPSAAISQTVLPAAVNIGTSKMLSAQGLSEAAQQGIKANLAYEVNKSALSNDLMLKAAVAAEEKVISPLLTRPISTVGLLGDFDSPLYAPGKYEKGFQVKDVASAYKRSEKVSAFVALTQSDLLPGLKSVSNIALSAGGIEVDKIDLWDDQNLKKNFSDNIVGQYFTGFGDFIVANAAILGAGRLVSAAAKSGARKAGLSTKGKTLETYETEINDGLQFINSGGLNGKQSVAATEINQLAATKDTALIADFVARNSNNDRLISFIERAEDPALIKDYILADKGYLPALDRLSRNNPSDLAELADFPGYIRAKNLIDNDTYQPEGSAVERIRLAFEDSIKKNPEHQEIYDAFMSPTGTPLSYGKTGAFPMEPIFAKNVFAKGRTQLNELKAAAATRDFSKVGWIDERIVGTRAEGMLVKLVQFSGTYKPLGFITFTGPRPFDGLVELNSQFDDLILFKNGRNKIETSVGKFETAADYRNRWVGRFLASKTDGERLDVLDELDATIGLDIARTIGYYDTKLIGELQTTLRQRISKNLDSFSRNGYGIDYDGKGLMASANTQRQLAESFRMSPWGIFEKELMRNAKNKDMAKLENSQAAMENVYEQITKYWTFDVLARPQYIIKQSYLEPILSSALSQGTKYIIEEIPSMTRNALINTSNRVKSRTTLMGNRGEMKAVNKAVKNKAQTLDKANQVLEMLQAEAQKYMTPGAVSPAMIRDNLAIIKRELKAADKLVDELELDFQDAVKPFGGKEDIPTITSLQRRIEFLEKEKPSFAIQEEIIAPVITDEASIISLLNSQRAKGFTVDSYPKQNDSLVNYTNGSGDYSLVNTGLREPKFLDNPKDVDKVKKITKDIDYLIDNAPALDTPITTFRGISDKDIVDKLLELKIGEVFTDKAFTSTSLSPKIGTRFARDNGLILEITNPVGTKGIFPIGYRVDVDKKLAAGESEWLLPRNAKFRVTGIDGNTIKVTLAKGSGNVSGFKVKNAAAIANAKSKISQARAEMNTLMPDVANINRIYADMEKVYKEIDDVMVSELNEARYAQAKFHGRSENFKKRSYGKGTEYRVIDGIYRPIESLFDENMFGSGMRAEFENGRTTALNYVDELIVGTRQDILLRRGPKTVTDITSPVYFEELAFIANRTLRGDKMVTLAFEGSSIDDIIKWAIETSEGKSYIRQFGDYSPDQVVSIVKNRVGLFNRYIPDVRARALILEKEVSAIELQKILTENKTVKLSALHPNDFEYDKIDEAVGAKGLGAIEAAADRAMGTIWSKLTSPENPVRWAYADKVFKDTVARKANMLAEQGVEITDKMLIDLRSAATREALQETEKVFYTVRRKNRALWASRTLVAFPSATANAFYRYGRLAIKNPTRFAGFLHNYQSAFRSFGIDQYGNDVEDPLKAQFLVLPGTKELGLMGGKGIRLNARSIGFLLNLPSLSFFSTVPIGYLIKAKPTREESMKDVLGPSYDYLFPYGVNQDPLSSLTPTWLLNYGRYITGNESDRDFLESVKSVANYRQALFEMGVAPMPSMDEIRSEARDLFRQKANWQFWSLAGVPAKVDTKPMQIFEQYYNILVNKYITQGSSRDEAVTKAGDEFLATISPNFPLDRITYSGSSSKTFIPATANAYKRVWTENAELINKLGSIDESGVLVGLITLDIDSSKEETSLSVYKFLKDPKTKLPNGITLNNVELTPEQEERRRSINRTWDKYTMIRDALEQVAITKYGKKSLRQVPELQKALKTYADTELKKENEDWWIEKEGSGMGADNSFKYARALSDIVGDKEFMKKHGKTPLWQDVSNFLTIRNSIVEIYRGLPDGDRRKAKLKESYLNGIDAAMTTFHPKLQDLLKRYFEDDTMKVIK